MQWRRRTEVLDLTWGTIPPTCPLQCCSCFSESSNFFSILCLLLLFGTGSSIAGRSNSFFSWDTSLAFCCRLQLMDIPLLLFGFHGLVLFVYHGLIFSPFRWVFMFSLHFPGPFLRPMLLWAFLVLCGPFSFLLLQPKKLVAGNCLARRFPFLSAFWFSVSRTVTALFWPVSFRHFPTFRNRLVNFIYPTSFRFLCLFSFLSCEYSKRSWKAWALEVKYSSKRSATNFCSLLYFSMLLLLLMCFFYNIQCTLFQFFLLSTRRKVLYFSSLVYLFQCLFFFLLHSCFVILTRFSPALVISPSLLLCVSAASFLFKDHFCWICSSCIVFWSRHLRVTISTSYSVRIFFGLLFVLNCFLLLWQIIWYSLLLSWNSHLLIVYYELILLHVLIETLKETGSCEQIKRVVQRWWTGLMYSLLFIIFLRISFIFLISIHCLQSYQLVCPLVYFATTLDSCFYLLQILFFIIVSCFYFNLVLAHL